MAIPRLGSPRRIVIDDVDMRSVRAVEYKVRYDNVDTVIIEILVDKVICDEDGVVRITTIGYEA